MSGNPYHNQHITEFTRCLEDTVMELQLHYNGQFKAIAEAFDSLEKRVTLLEKEVFRNEQRRPQVEADIYVTKTSL